MTKQTVGVLKGIKAQERRISRQPDSAAELAHIGRESFLLQSGASERAAYVEESNMVIGGDLGRASSWSYSSEASDA
jgi:NAD/NADP transhydrogenase alpha subunit